MRAVCFVKRLQWDVPGTLFRHGLTIGDVDNDGDNELVVGTAEGDLFIFKGSHLWHKISGLGFITCVEIGDIFNYGCNALIVICGDGWVHIFYCPRSVYPSINVSTYCKENTERIPNEENIEKLKNSVKQMKESEFLNSIQKNNSNKNEISGKIKCVHVQRIPSNTKVALIADVDKDGANELIIGLTDRVVRSYRWSSNTDVGTGKLVGLNKWECANQIGMVTLQDNSEGIPTLLVAQPGGTFIRIKCNPEYSPCSDTEFDTVNEPTSSTVDYQRLGISRMRNPNISTEILGNLQPRAVKQTDVTNKISTKDIEETLCPTHFQGPKQMDLEDVDTVDGNLVGGNIIMGEIEPEKPNKNYYNKNLVNSPTKPFITKLKEEHKTKINTKPYALATLDGTIMLVKDEIILWAMQVDHHISALCRLDVTGDGADEIIACAWDGQTYILDQQKNSVRFQFEEPVRGFCAGMYSVFPKSSSPSLVYNTFHGKVYLYYDVNLPSLVSTGLIPEESLGMEDKSFLKKILRNDEDIKHLTEWLLYHST